MDVSPCVQVKARCEIKSARVAVVRRPLDILLTDLVVHAPAAVDELELSVGDESSHDLLHLRRLSLPPHLEEGLLDVDELSICIELQLLHDGVEDVAHGRVLNRIVRAQIVLVNGLQPAWTRTAEGKANATKSWAERQRRNNERELGVESSGR